MTVAEVYCFQYNAYVTSNKEKDMNSYLYDDLQSDELLEFHLYETEQEYWEEYDQIHTMMGR